MRGLRVAGSVLAALIGAGNFGGTPLYLLGPKAQRQITASPRGHKTTYWPPSMRNGQRERARRVRQMARARGFQHDRY